MGKKSKRGSGPRPGSNRAERVAARKARQFAAVAAPARPFEGLAAECDLVALRAFVASATARLDLIEPGPPEPELTSVVPGDTPTPPPPAPAGVRHEVYLGTILPGAAAAIVRKYNTAPEGMVGLQVDPEPIDVAAALSAAISWAAHAEVGAEYVPDGDPAPLTEILKPDSPLDITVYEDFSWWMQPGTDIAGDVAVMLERANDTIMPTARMAAASGIGAPWWVDAGEKAHLRWVRPEPEDDLMNALARVHAAGHLTLGDGSRFAGSFRTHGVLVPVFDLDPERHHEEWYSGLNEFDNRLTEALGLTADLTAAERSSRDGIRGRQVTLR